MELRPHQVKALGELASGSVLRGGVGSGKTLVGLRYFEDNFPDRTLYVITTARKRDAHDWYLEAAKAGVHRTNPTTGEDRIFVDSWNNIGKYEAQQDAFFIFDEQRAVGSGKWADTFVKIAKRNKWIMLSATPGDNWEDYIPLFLANGFFKNRTEIKTKHLIYSWYGGRYPKLVRILDEDVLEGYRDRILVEMPFERTTTRHVEYVECTYNTTRTRHIQRERNDPDVGEPYDDISAVLRAVRKETASDPSRLEYIRELMERFPRIIIFYQYNYELDILRTLSDSVTVAEYNGMVKEDIPDERRWVYLVQYAAGAEAWNCTLTNAMVFYSLTPSYKQFEQAQGRIDRLDTAYFDLFYFVLTSNNVVDKATRSAIEKKKDFNEREWFSSINPKGKLWLETP